MLFLLLLGGAAGALEVHRLVQRRTAPGGDAELQTLRQRERMLKQALQVLAAPTPSPDAGSHTLELV
jgi:cell division protein FtsB